MGGFNDEGVIMIEDDPSMSEALARIVRLGGFVATPYASAEAFLHDSRDARPLCMIIDVRLPGMDGLALHEHLVARGSVPPVIFITAFEEPGARAYAARTGSAFLAKPFSGRQLLETIHAIRRGRPPSVPEP